MSEGAKIYPVIKKYLKGKILDIGCGDRKICENAIGVDVRKTDAVDCVLPDFGSVYSLYLNGNLRYSDVVFASHFLEHLTDPAKFITESWMILKDEGLLILYLPSAHHYDNRSNPEHFQSYEYEVFLRWFYKAFECSFEVIEHGQDIGDDRYSFYVVARKK